MLAQRPILDVVPDAETDRFSAVNTVCISKICMRICGYKLFTGQSVLLCFKFHSKHADRLLESAAPGLFHDAPENWTASI